MAKDKTVRALIVRPDGTLEEKELNFLGITQEVGGFVERINFQGVDGLVNEDGKSANLPANCLATQIAQVREAGLSPFDHISGTLVLVGPVNGRGDWTDVPVSVVLQARRLAEG